MLSDEWLSRYEILKNLHIKLCRSVTGTRTRTTGVTTIALLVLRKGEKKSGVLAFQKVAKTGNIGKKKVQWKVVSIM